jgi:hypothetical protein
MKSLLLRARGQKILKIIHIVMVGLWIGGTLALILMMLFLGPGQSGGELLGYDLARKFVDDFIIIPGIMGCLFSGLLISLFTTWGFFKHRWVSVKWILTVACIIFGTFYLGPRINGQPLITTLQGASASTDPIYMAARFQNLVGGGFQLLAIIFMIVISVVKPWKKNKPEEK